MIESTLSSVIGSLLSSFITDRKAVLTILLLAGALWLATGAGYVRWGREEVGQNEVPAPPQMHARQGRSDEQLNILVFNATSTRPVGIVFGRGYNLDPTFLSTVNQLKRILDDCSIDAREYWSNRRVRLRTEVLYSSPSPDHAPRGRSR